MGEKKSKKNKKKSADAYTIEVPAKLMPKVARAMGYKATCCGKPPEKWCKKCPKRLAPDYD